MTRARRILPLVVLAGLVAPAVHAGVPVDAIGDSKVSIEGLVQTDGYWYRSDPANLDADPGDGSDTDFGLRRAELVLKGEGRGNFTWILGYDAAGDGKFLDANVKLGIGGGVRNSIIVGQFKQPNSLEELSSTRNNDFIAKAAITSTYAISRRLGAAWNYGGDNWGGTASYFGRELTRNRGVGAGYGLRGYWTPIDDKGSFLHFGLSYVNHDTDSDSLRILARPVADYSNRLIDTGILADADRVSTLGLESAWMSGPFKLQGEYMRTNVKRHGATGDFSSDGGYLSGMWNITGETWKYKNGTPTTPLPSAPARGMWQLGLRYDTLDLNDGAVKGGRMAAWTAGVNWYLRANFKLALDYVRASSSKYDSVFGHDRNDAPGIIAARAQFYW